MATVDTVPRQLLRFATIGSVDDGKSTLIGRLLHDAKGLFDDQVDAIARTTARRGQSGLDLSLATDGLRAEREQGITIDVAYRYFATPARSFVIGDNPGHAQYTRNMATGASTADAVVALVDVRTGLVDQTRRHLAVAATLGIRHVVVAVNKMDLVAWDQASFEAVADQVRSYLSRLGVHGVVAIPVSALEGGNVVEPDARCGWYDGPTLLGQLEALDVATLDEGRTGMRLPVQLVLRSTEEGSVVRRIAGTVCGDDLVVGQPLVALPSGARTTVAVVETPAGRVSKAHAGLAVTVQLADDIDVSRGDVLCDAHDPAIVTRSLQATVCWFAERPLHAGDRVLVKQATRTERAVVRTIGGRLDLDLLELVQADEVRMNDIAVVHVALAGPLAVDTYERSRATGGILVIDEVTNATLGAGMVQQR